MFNAGSCTPITEVKRGEPGERTSTERVEDSGVELPEKPLQTKVEVGTVVAQASACSEEGAHACVGHGVREISVCKAGAWTADTPCKMNERCDSTQGKCLPVAAVCSGQEAGAMFCDGDKRLICDDLVASRELSCGPNQECSRKDGNVSCTCSPGATPSASGMGCEVVSGCSADGSGCDPMTQCTQGSECTACPTGYIGSGRKGCVPQLTALSVSCGTGGASQTVALSESVYEYRVKVPVTCQSVTLMAAGPLSAQLEIDGVTVEPETPWSSAQLHIGENPVKLVVTAARSGRSSSYQLKVERAASKSEFIKASNADNNDGFGFAIAAEGGTLIVGAPYEYGDGSSPSSNSVRDAGAVYVFQLEKDGWVEKQYLKALSPRASDLFGSSVAISGDLLVVGAPRFNIALFKVAPPDQPGTAHVFSRQGAVWKHEAVLTAGADAGADMFGFHVAIQGERVLVGAPYDGTGGPRAGAVYSFVRNGGTWTQEQKVLAATPIADSSFGVSMAIEGEVFVAGAQQDPTAAEAAGSAYVFVREAGMWRERQRLQAPKPVALATFGMTVAINSGRVLVAAPGLDLRQRPTPAGEAYLYQRESASSPWALAAQFRSPAPRSVDLFGAAAALTATSVVIGANGDASSARGIDADPTRTDAALSGAAHVFSLQGSEYAQSAYLKAFNSDADDCYGHSVAVTDSFLAVSAPYEESGQRGISSEDKVNLADKSASNSGAVYVYR